MAPRKILVINPNSSESMTESLDHMIESLNEQLPFSAKIHTYTAPSGPPSINNEKDARLSARIVLSDLETELSQYDAFLVACYSVHPLVEMLRQRLAPHQHVTGIFEASISTALALLPIKLGYDRETRDWMFGIVSTGTYWKEALELGVGAFLGQKDPDRFFSDRFMGVETTGLNAIELHTAPPEEVKRKLMDATRRLATDSLKVICLGCAGMFGLDSIVEEALVEALGAEEAKKVHIVDGVKAGLGLLEGLLRALPGPER